MTDAVKIHPDDDTVWALTLDAVKDSQGRKQSLTVRCSQCRRALAGAGQTKNGALFVSYWELEQGFTGVFYKGQRVPRRVAIKGLDRIMPVVDQSGPASSEPAGQFGFALLELPCELAQDYPDLLVRCARHGDAVLNRIEVLELLGQATEKLVDVAFPHREYRSRDDFPGFPSSTSREVRHLKFEERDEERLAPD
jgi:hypothetical protein